MTKDDAMSGRKQPTTETIRAADALAQWSTLLDQVTKHDIHVLLETDGVPVAAIISAKELRRLERIAAAWDEPFKALDRTREAFKDIPDDELEREVEKAVTEARAELRAERDELTSTS